MVTSAHLQVEPGQRCCCGPPLHAGLLQLVADELQEVIGLGDVLHKALRVKVDLQQREREGVKQQQCRSAHNVVQGCGDVLHKAFRFKS